MATTSSVEALAPFVPSPVLRRLAAARDAEDFRADAARGVVLFADIAGFTPLTERLTRRGPIGAEELRETLNVYFGQLIDLVTRHGGDVLTFAGDAMIASWVADAARDLAACARLALACARAAQQRLGGFKTRDGSPLGLRIGVAAGPLYLIDAGGVGGKWFFLAAGPLLRDAGRAKRHAEHGDVVASPEARALAGDHVGGENVGDGCLRVLTMVEPVLGAVTPPIVPPHAAAALRRYVPATVLDRLDAGQSDWLAEFRTVSVLFVRLPDLTFERAPDAERLHAATRVIQEQGARLEGSIIQLLMDDVSTVFVLVFGLPPLAHEEDPARAVALALRIADALGDLGVRSSAGITTGRAYCGAFGTAERHEYALIGDVMNVAARLMVAAGDGVLCDAATRAAADAAIEFGEPEMLALKGKATPIEGHRPRRERAGGPSRRRTRLRAVAGRTPSIVGREVERAIVHDALARLAGGRGGVLVIEGEPGIGKSRLVEDLIERAHDTGIAALVGSGDAVEHASTYHAWRPVFARIVEDPAVAAGPTLRSGWAPLLSGIVPLELPENDVTAAMAGQARAETTRDLLVELLHDVSARQPTAVVIDDAHWLDSASWTLAAAVPRRVPAALLVLVTRPLPEPAPPEFVQIVASPATQRVPLAHLDADSVVQLVCRRLNVDVLPAAVAALIREKAEGNPLFSEELAHALRDAGVIAIEDGRCRLAGDASQLAAVNFPDTVQGVITSRIDRLAPPERLTARVASVVGRTVPFRVLRAVYPAGTTDDELKRHLEALATLDLIPLDSPEPELTYVFKHIITQEVAYQTLSFAQRRQLHRGAAEWYERAAADDPDPPYPLLAHHWESAGVTPRAIDAHEKAGDAAVRSFANAEAVRFFGAARRLDADADEPAGPMRRAHWARMLGKAHRELGAMVESRAELLEALRLLGEPVPEVAWRLGTRTLSASLRQVAHRVRPGWLARRARVPAGTAEHRRRQELVDAAIEFSYLCYFSNDMPPILWATALALNAAESVGPSMELAAMYACAGGVSGFLPLHGLARTYFRLGADVAEAIGQPLALAQVHHYEGHYLGGVGDWPRFRETLERAMDVYDRYGNRRRWDECLTNAAFFPLFTGDFERALDEFTQLERSARRREDVQITGWALLGQARALVRLGRCEEALERIAAMEPHIRDRLGALEFHGVACGAWLRLGRSADAVDAADRAAALIAEKPPPSYTTALTFGYVAEAYLTGWRDAGGAAFAVRAGHACRALRAFARIFGIGEPAALLWQGVHDWLAGRRRRARAAWRRGLASAERRGMRYEVAQLHLWIGELDEASGRASHLRAARTGFESLGCRLDAARAARGIGA